MRLGKEQAVGYVEDTEAEGRQAEELATTQPAVASAAEAAEPSLTAS